MKDARLTDAVAAALPDIPSVFSFDPVEPASCRNVNPDPRADSVGDFLTNSEAAALVRCHPRTLQRRVYTDGFPAPVKFGERVHYRRDEVMAYIRRKLDDRGREQAR